MSDTYRKCRWCGRSYVSHQGEYKNLCTQKCQHEFYQLYPGQRQADREQDAKETAAFWKWFKIIVGGLILFYLIASN